MTSKSSNVHEFPTGALVIDNPAPSAEALAVNDTLAGLQEAIVAVSKLPARQMLTMRYQKPDGEIVGVNWLLRQYQKKLTEVMVAVQNQRAAKSTLSGADLPWDGR